MIVNTMTLFNRSDGFNENADKDIFMTRIFFLAAFSIFDNVEDVSETSRGKFNR